MILKDIKNLVEERGEICLSEIYTLVDADHGLVDQALFELVSKGHIFERDLETACSGCPARCSKRGEKVYRPA